MNYYRLDKKIKCNSRENGVALWMSGCTAGCEECSCPEIQNFSLGTSFTKQTMIEILEALTQTDIKRFVIKGGNPLDLLNIHTTYDICRNVKSARPDIDVWIYTNSFMSVNVFKDYKPVSGAFGGYYNALREVVRGCDYIVDRTCSEADKGTFLGRKFLSNQRLIDVKNTIKTGKIQLLEEK